MSGRLRGCVGNLVLALVSTGLGLGVLEAGARLLHGRQRGGKEQETRVLYTRHDPLLGWRKVPGARVRYARREYVTDVEINSLGLRDRERRHENPEGAFRVMLLGDSFIEAFSVRFEDSVGARLESLLGAGARPAEVLNAGTVGWSNDQECLYYRDEGARFGPQVVLLFVYHNDILANAATSWNGRPKPKMDFTKGYLRLANVPVPEGAPIVPRPPDPPPAPRGSLAWGMLTEGIELRAPGLYAALARVGVVPPLRVLPISNEFDVFRRAWPQETERAMALTGDILRTCAADAWERGARFGVVYIPTRMEVNDSDWAWSRLRYGLDPAGWDRARLAASLEAWGREARYPVLDLTPALRAETSFWKGRVYYQTDSHWNARGHGVVAAALRDWLRSLGWLPA